jgi:hypothetical protein
MILAWAGFGTPGTPGRLTFWVDHAGASDEEEKEKDGGYGDSTIFLLHFISHIG